MVSRSHDLEAELSMHSFTINFETFRIEEQAAVDDPVTMSRQHVLMQY